MKCLASPVAAVMAWVLMLVLTNRACGEAVNMPSLHCRFETPPGWVPMVAGELDAIRTGHARHVECGYRKPGDTQTYLLIESMEPYPENPKERLWSTNDSLVRPTWDDRRKLAKSEITVNSLHEWSYFLFGSEKTVAIRCYCPAQDETADGRMFETVADSFTFDPMYMYVEKPSVSSGTIINIAVGVALFVVPMGVFALKKKKRKGLGTGDMPSVRQQQDILNMKKSHIAMILICAAMFLVGLYAVRALRTWTVYTSTDGGFVARFPARPSEKTDEVSAPGGISPVHTVGIGHKDGSEWTIIWGDAEQEKDANAAAEGKLGLLRARYVSRGKKVLSERMLTIAGHPGCEIEAAGADGMIYLTRFVMVKKRGYEITAYFPPTPNRRADAATFLDSFTLLNP